MSSWNNAYREYNVYTAGVTSAAEVPGWTDEVLLPITTTARVLGQRPSTLTSRRDRGPGLNGLRFPDPAQGTMRSAVYRLGDVLRYWAEVKGAPVEVRLADHLLAVAQARSDETVDPARLRQQLAVLTGVVAGVVVAYEVPEHVLVHQALVAEAIAEVGAAAVVDALLDADDRLTKGAATFTRRDLAALVADVAGDLASAPVETVLDPCCGEATLLVEVARAVAARQLVGHELDDLTRSVAAVRLALSCPELEGRIGLTGDAFSASTEDQVPAQLVVAEIPFNDGDPYRWLELSLGRLSEEGRAVLVCPDTILTDPATSRRANILDSSRLRAVVRLPRSLRTHPKSRVPTLVVLGPAATGEAVLVVDLHSVDWMRDVGSGSEGIPAEDSTSLSRKIADASRAGRWDSRLGRAESVPADDLLRVADVWATIGDASPVTYEILRQPLREALAALDQATKTSQAEGKQRGSEIALKAALATVREAIDALALEN